MLELDPAEAAFTSHAEYAAYLRRCPTTAAAQQEIERRLIPAAAEAFTVDGYCHPCGRQMPLAVGFAYAAFRDGRLVPNWREWLVCPHCRLNNRQRAAVRMFELYCRPEPAARIYLTEQLSPLYRQLAARFPGLCGSEYCPDGDVPGVRHEDLTALTFADGTFAHVLTFDVLEHIPGYERALAECLRCLKPGGCLLLSVPFAAAEEHNCLRATVAATGEITHLLPAEYHGDPCRAGGCLCYHRFGWELLTVLRSVGFTEVCARRYWSPALGHLGGNQFMFTARRPGA